MKFRRLHLPLLLLVAGLLGGRCGGGGFQVSVDTPNHGAFLTSSNVSVSGSVNAANPQLASLTVNGISALPVGSGGAWSVSLPLDPAAVFHSILVEGVRTNGAISRKVVTVHHGEHVADGDFSPMGVALRLNDVALDKVEPLVVGSVQIDLGSFIPVGTFVANISNLTFEWDIYIDNPAPEIDGFSLDIDSQTNAVRGDVDIHGAEVHLYLQGLNFVTSDCTARVTTNGPLEVNGSYDLRADPFDPFVTDVEQVGNVSFGSTQFDIEITSGFVCEIGEFFGLIGGNLSGDIEAGLAGFLNDPDGPDSPPGAHPLDGPIADEVEAALADVEISGPIGQGLGVNLETPLFDVFEDDAGITLDSDARITTLMPDPNAVDLAASYHVPEAFPSYGATSPSGFPYELALGVSTSAFNQLLKAEVESGLLISTISELANPFPPFIPATLPITAQLLSFLIPEFGTLDPNLLLHIDLKPLLAPVVTGSAGPLGELADLRIGGLEAIVRGENSVFYLKVIVNAKVGLDVAFDGGALAFVLGTPDPANIQAVVELNPLGADTEDIEQNLLPDLIASALPALASSLGTFPLPSFLGLQLDLVEVTRNGQFISLFTDLVPVGTVFQHDYTSTDFQTPELTLVGDAFWATDNDPLFSPHPQRLRLTSNATHLNGSAWYNARTIDPGSSWNVQYRFQISYPFADGADGIGFHLQADGLGANPDETGGGLGSPHFSVVVDTWNNGPEGTDESLRMILNGTQVYFNDLLDFPSDPTPGSSPTVFRMELNYDGPSQELRVRLVDEGSSDVLDNTFNVDLGVLGPSHVGFSARTGGFSENHDIRTWRLIAP